MKAILFWLSLLGVAYAAAGGGGTITLPAKSYAPGTYTIPEITLSANFSTFQINLNRTNFTDPGTKVSIMMDLSGDAGKTWVNNACGFSTVGDPATTTKPNVVTCYCTKQNGCDGSSAANKMRGTAVITGQAVTLAGSIVAQ